MGDGARESPRWPTADARGSLSRRAGTSHGPAREAGLETTQALESGRTFRFVLGRDLVPQPIDLNTDDRPRDPFATRVLFAGHALPLSLRALLAHLDGLDGNPLAIERSFVVADGGQIAWTSETDDLQRNFRLVITRQAAAGQNPDILVSASTNLDSTTAFLQVVVLGRRSRRVSVLRSAR